MPVVRVSTLAQAKHGQATGNAELEMAQRVRTLSDRARGLQGFAWELPDTVIAAKREDETKVHAIVRHALQKEATVSPEPTLGFLIHGGHARI